MGIDNEIQKIQEVRERFIKQRDQLQSAIEGLETTLAILKDETRSESHDIIRQVHATHQRNSNSIDTVAPTVAPLIPSNEKKFILNKSKPFDSEVKRAISFNGHAIRKQDLEAMFNGRAGSVRHAINRLKKKGEIVLATLNNSKKFCYWALAEWTKEELQSDKKKLAQEYAPKINSEYVDAELLEIKAMKP